MNWKTDLKLSDLDGGIRLELTCTRCGLTHYEQAGAVLARKGFRDARLDEVEARLRCPDRFCRGALRLALVHADKSEGFVGGMA